MSDNKSKNSESQIDIESLVREFYLYESPVSSKQADIIKAAEELFALKGPSNTPTAEIAKTAGVTEKTLFKYFPKKEYLIKRVLFPLILKTVFPYQLNDILKTIRKNNSNPESFFRALFENRIEAAKIHGPKLKIFLTEIMQNDNLRNKIFDLASSKVLAEINVIIQDFQNKKMIRGDVKPTTITRVIFGTLFSQLIFNFVLSNYDPKDHSPITELDIDDILSITLKGILI